MAHAKLKQWTLPLPMIFQRNFGFGFGFSLLFLLYLIKLHYSTSTFLLKQIRALLCHMFNILEEEEEDKACSCQALHPNRANKEYHFESLTRNRSKDMGSFDSSSSSVLFSPKKYDVFISFRAEDTRTNFTSHLHAALYDKSIRTYIDSELPKGDHISQALIQAIQDSSISLVVFSQNYASSKWCLGELTQILQCQKNDQQLVIPVFYKVDPSDVRKQNGSYKEAFAKHEKDFMYNLHKVENWKDALFKVANLGGWDSRTFRDESELIQNIVNDILRKLNLRYPSDLKGLVGIEDNCNHIELLLENVPTIGIWGMGGIGKTIMAKAVFSKLVSQFDSYCFVENVREESEKHGLSYIRDKLIRELLKEENLHGSLPKVLGSTFVTRRLLNCKKVFIVLDDVNKSEQLEYLNSECDCLGPGSKLIITTRDKQLLIGRVNEIHEAKALSYCESLKLLSLNAFNQSHPKIGYEELSERAVIYTKGNPLALKVLGSHFRTKSMEIWESTLRKLKKCPNVQIHNVLKVSYDGLDCVEKDIFLDIAFFFKGERRDDVIRLLDAFGFWAARGIDSLIDKALLTISHENEIQMHDLIQEMGWKIVHEESSKNPGGRSRLRDIEEVYDVLKNNKGTDAVEGIILNVSQIRDVHLSADTFKKMPNLRFFKFYFDRYKRSCNVNLPSGLELFSDKLRYFQWDGYPSEFLPLNFCAESLVELRMENSHVKKLWNGVQDLVNLKIVTLTRCCQLMELPDFSKAHNLELVDLSYCRSLCSVHPSILSLHRLVTLNLLWCMELKSLQSESHLKSLRDLDIGFCFSLKEFSLSSEELTYLQLGSTRIEILHSSVGRLSKLRSLDLNGSKLKNLPIKELSCLRSLEKLRLFYCGHLIDKRKLHMLFDGLCSLRALHLNGCCNLFELPDNISVLSKLNNLELQGSSVESLPTCVKHLSCLRRVNLRDCKRLRTLPELPPSIEYLDANNCTSLEIVLPLISIPKSNHLSLFSFKNCARFDEYSLIMEFIYLYMSSAAKRNFEGFNVCYPGSRVPRWFRYKQKTEAPIPIKLDPSFDDPLGFVCCSVLSQSISKKNFPFSLECHCYLEDGVKKSSGCGYSLTDPELNSDHVFMWYFPLDKRMTTYNPKLSFEFFVFTYGSFKGAFGCTLRRRGKRNF